jgi:hypothetical protein
MGFQPSAKRLIAGLTVVGLMFQVALVAAQLSISITAKADAAATLPANVICTEHGLAVAPADETDRPSECVFCPLCLTGSAGQVAVLPAAGSTLVQARGDRVVFHLNADCLIGESSAQPRSRGPPAFV